MFDSNWKTWAMLAVAAIGISFEILKRMPPQDGVSWHRENLRYADEGKPYSVRDLPKQTLPRITPPPSKIGRVAGDSKILEAELKAFTEANKPTQTEAEHKEGDKSKDAKDKVKKKKKKDDEEWEEFIDPATGKKMRRKKKKPAAKKEEPPKEVAKPEEPPKPPVDENDIDGALNEVITGALPAPKNTTLDPMATLEEWERRLLSRPDLAETRRFIEAFKNNMVSPAVFYKIAQMMVEDSRPEMKQLGLLCAGSVISTNSFAILTSVEKGNSSSNIRQQSTDLIKKYSELSNLPVLKNVLSGSSSDMYSLLRATQLTDHSAQTYLRLTYNTNTPNSPTSPAGSVHPANGHNNNNNGPTAPNGLNNNNNNPNTNTPNSGPNNSINRSPTSQAKSGSKALQSFIPVLQQLAKRTRDSNLIGQCQQTISNIQTLVARTMPTSTPTPNHPNPGPNPGPGPGPNPGPPGPNPNPNPNQNIPGPASSLALTNSQ